MIWSGAMPAFVAVLIAELSAASSSVWGLVVVSQACSGEAQNSSPHSGSGVGSPARAASNILVK